MNESPKGSWGDERERLRDAVILAHTSHHRALSRATSKDHLRRLHQPYVAEAIERAAPALREHEADFVAELCEGRTLAPDQIEPVLEPVVRGQHSARLFRWITLHWSIPVSNGYGRRLRLLVRDANHGGAVIGIIGLGDPVFSIRGRDAHIGWTADDRRIRLRYVMDAFVLGAVPPYSELIGIKLVTLMLNSLELGKQFSDKYSESRSRIADRRFEGKLAAVTTTSALGRSAAYNRLRNADGTLAAILTGRTSGTGDIHISPELYTDLRTFGIEQGLPNSRHENWGGNGFRNRRDTLKRVLRDLGLNTDYYMDHGIQRPTYIIPRSKNYRAFLTGREPDLLSSERSAAEISEWWRERWGIPRAARGAYATFEPAAWRLWP